MTRSAIVTGGTGGLGAAVTAALLDDGWRVVVPWVAERELERVSEHERLELVQADLGDPAAAGGVAAAAGEGLRAVVNLVGGFAMGGRVHETPVEEFERQLTLNLRPAYLVTSAAIPAMLAAGEGSVVCVSSRAALRPFPGAAGYITSKAAVLALVDALHAEYVQDGIRVNAILPSVIDTPANREWMPAELAARAVPPASIARVIAFLAGPDSAPTSGARVPVYGDA
jgi:NAD(P)-dependent dehydrogenase (short-subunit alcohol dehydrogenase family)